MKKSKSLKILFASSEVAPFAKTGGLADVSASLPAALASLGHHVVVVMPLYRSVKEGRLKLKKHEVYLDVPFRGNIEKDQVLFSELSDNVRIYFVNKNEFFDRSALYGTPEGDYPDNAERFIFFSRAVLSLSQLLEFHPDIVHCNDWQTGLVPVYLKILYKDDSFFSESRTVFTIHNLAYQGLFPDQSMAISGLPRELFSMEGLEYYGKMNFLKGGIVFSDAITTVSEKYSHEIQTKEYGYGLEGVLQNRAKDILGILNGVDYEEWSPENDTHLAANYDLNDLSGKRKCKLELLELFELDRSENAPLIGIISRLAAQKGFDILAEAVEELIESGVSLILLGTGDKTYEKQFAELGEKHRGHFGVKIAFDNALAHKIEAGADMFLMPSRYEPCGLNQMYSMRYGTIPVVRATGGLDDTIKEFDARSGKGNGFKFAEYSSGALVEAVKRAMRVYEKRDVWLGLMKNAMEEDFSWNRSALRYEKVYWQILQGV